MVGTRLKAGALQLTLFIMVVVALLLASFVLLVHTHKRFNLQTDLTVGAIRNTDFGVDYALNNALGLGDTVSIDLRGGDYKELKVHRDFWGLFEKVISKSTVKNRNFQKVALVGAAQPKTNPMALYVEDNNRPLVLVGRTRIEGTAYLPERGARTGNISGHSYYGSQLVYGPTRTSKTFPELFSQTRANIKTLNGPTGERNQERFLRPKPGGSYGNSFFSPLQYVMDTGTLTLRDVQLTGHIMVQSRTRIVVEPSAKLRDVILMAPEIEVNDRTIGTFQCIASRSIKVGRNCRLDYPSALVLSEGKTVAQEPEDANVAGPNGIVLGSHSTMEGAVVYLGQPKSGNYRPQVVLETDSKVIGEVYCNQNLELKGSVLGSVFTSNFIAQQFGSVYQNHLYNATINANGLPREYVGLTFDNTEQKGIIKWLY